ncbi:YciI family protein [Mesorhizobium sp. STM 4661]|uniref:YciI family protein n=1 Tax=Mesorhizobium sp. STM 4661 TaxID=1297570 RepID=UPI00055BA321|nr:YciI family protein [Mesorhizobium sp. STM 4661]
MLWTVYCLDRADTAEARAEHLTVHREYLDQFKSRIFFSGPLQNDDASVALGSLFILNVPARVGAEDFISNEPFYKAGIFEKIAIYRMRKGRYNPDLVDIV